MEIDNTQVFSDTITTSEGILKIKHEPTGYDNIYQKINYSHRVNKLSSYIYDAFVGQYDGDNSDIMLRILSNSAKFIKVDTFKELLQPLELDIQLLISLVSTSGDIIDIQLPKYTFHNFSEPKCKYIIDNLRDLLREYTELIDSDANKHVISATQEFLSKLNIELNSRNPYDVFSHHIKNTTSLINRIMPLYETADIIVDSTESDIQTQFVYKSYYKKTPKNYSDYLTELNDARSINGFDLHVFTKEYFDKHALTYTRIDRQPTSIFNSDKIDAINQNEDSTNL